jgi:hypothetical protein
MAVGPGRIMPDVLLVSALQFRNPIQIFIQMKVNDFARGAYSCLHGLHGAPFVFEADAAVTETTCCVA